MVRPEPGTSQGTTLEEVIRGVLVAYSIDATHNQGLHGWRCEYVERYGPCYCFDELVDDLVLAVDEYWRDHDAV